MQPPPSIDHETRSQRFIAAMRGLSALLAGQAPGLHISGSHMHGLVDLLADEANAISTTDHPAKMAANDQEKAQ